MNDDFIIKGPAMIPGITDRVGDRQLTGEEIQKGAYQFLANYGVVDVQHSFKRIGDPVESYIAPEPTRFNNINYPAGTWFLTTRVTDPNVQQAIMKGELTGYSVGAMPEKEYNELKRNLPITKAMFSDVDEGAWFPLAVSIVDMPAVSDAIFKVFAPLEFIKKEHPKNGGKNMSEENDKTRDSLLEKMFDHFIKKEESKEVETGKEEDKTESEFVTMEQLDSKLDSFKTDILDAIKGEDDEEEEEASEESEGDNADEESEEEDGEDAGKPAGEPAAITKSLSPDSRQTAKKKSFNEQIGRNNFGVKE